MMISLTHRILARFVLSPIDSAPLSLPRHIATAASRSPMTIEAAESTGRAVSQGSGYVLTNRNREIGNDGRIDNFFGLTRGHRFRCLAFLDSRSVLVTISLPCVALTGAERQLAGGGQSK